MSDPIERMLADLGSTIEGGAMPRSAADARRRGDQIRRRTHALVAAGSAAAVVAVAVPIIVLTSGDHSSKEPPPADPSPEETVELSEADLITNEDTVYQQHVDWEVISTGEGDGQSAYNPCAERGLSEMSGAGTVFTRSFELWTPDGPIPEDWMSETIAEFDDAGSARAAYVDIAAAIEDCGGRIPGSDRYTVSEDEPVAVPVDGEGRRFLSWYGPVPGDELDVESFIMETGLVVSGDRLAVATSVVVGQDYSFATRPMERMLPAVAERLQPGGEAPPSEDTAGRWLLTIPEDLPLTVGFPDESEETVVDVEEPSRDNTSLIAEGQLDACGRTPDAFAPADRITARYTGADDGAAREVLAFANGQDAATFLAHLRVHYADCTTDDSEPPYVVTTFSTDPWVGDEALAVERTVEGGVGRTAILAVRIGNAVLLAVAGDAGSDARQLREAELATVEPVLAAMYAAFLPEAEPNTTPDAIEDTGDDPAAPPVEVATTIADDYPLADGWPDADGEESEVTGPEPGGEIEHTACGETYAEPAYADRLTASFTQPEDGRLRQLTTYKSADAAVEAVAALRTFYDGCQQEDSEPAGFVAHYEVRQTEVGGESWVIYQHYTYNGDPATGIRIFTVIRVGLAVLVIEASNEGGASNRVDDEVDAQVTGMVEDAAAPLGAMCVFTEAGC